MPFFVCEMAKGRKNTPQTTFGDWAGFVHRDVICKPFVGAPISVYGFRNSGCCASIGSFRNGLRMSFGFPDVAKPAIDLGFLLTQLAKLFFKVLTLEIGPVFVPFFILAENPTNAGFQRAPFFKTSAK